MCSSWSSKIDLESCSSRPMSVDLPSSTLPTVAKRSGATRPLWVSISTASASVTSEVALTLAVLHARLRDPVVGTRRATLGDPGDRRLGDDVLDGEGRRRHGGGAGGVTDRAEADRR